MTAIDHEALVAMLDRLKLSAIRDQLDTLLDEAARSKMTLREALAFFVSREIARRDERRISMASKLAQFPFEANAAHLFFQLVSRRYERGSILITSNRSVGEWGGVFGDPVVATAILDRLLHHSAVITIRGDSYRLREKRRSGLLQKAGPTLENTETTAP
jgi:DNA replication protein DnaC